MIYIDLLSAHKKQKYTKNKFSLSQWISLVVFFAIATFLVSVSAVAQAAIPMPEISSPLNGQQFATPVPKIFGQAEGDEVRVFIDDILNGRAEVKLGGSYEYTPFLPLSSGLHTVSVESFDKATLEISPRASTEISIVPNPAPTFLAPSSYDRLGQDRAWVGGVAQNNSLVIVFVDGVENARAEVKNHKSGTGSFGVQLNGLDIGYHTVTAIARDYQGKESFVSEPIIIEIAHPTPAPVLYKPVVNTDSGIERPFIAGLAKNGLELSIIIDNKIVETFMPDEHPSGTANFAWQPKEPLDLGRLKIEVFASDNGKLSNNSEAVYWQVGGEFIIGGEEIIEEPKEENKEEPITIKEEGEVAGESSIIVRDKTEEAETGIKVEGEAEKEEIPVIPDTEGRVQADDDIDVIALGEEVFGEGEEEIVGEPGGVTEITPGSVVRLPDEEEEQKPQFNTSLIIGIVILLFLLFSMIVWYVQEKRAGLEDKVVEMFREKEGGEDKKEPITLKMPEIENNEEEEKKYEPKEPEDPDDFMPPPPPPAF